MREWLASLILLISAWAAPVQPGNKNTVNVVVAPQQSATSIVQTLQSRGLIRSATAARWYLILSGKDQKIQAGTYVVSAGQSLGEMVKVLTQKPKDVWVTIPEGWRREQIALRLDQALAGEQKIFDIQEFVDKTATLEGQLFPDTYLLPLYINTDEVIALLVDTFRRKTGLDMSKAVDREVLITASLVEREAREAADRPVIAGIILKRLRAGWPLQIDASVQYGRDSIRCLVVSARCEWWQPLADTKLPSTYNTYLHLGLPPTSIANPGLAAITAAREPVTSSYWYYLTAPTGVTYYAQTLQQHQANIDKYLKR